MTPIDSIVYSTAAHSQYIQYYALIINYVLTNFARTLSGTFLGVGHKAYEEE